MSATNLTFLNRCVVLVLAVLLVASLAFSTSASAASCVGSMCTNQDPYATACNSDASVVATAPIVDASGQAIGELKLYWSPVCQSNWGQAYFHDGNPANTPPVTVSVVGSSATTYDSGPVVFSTTAAGSPVWGNMVYSPGCSYAKVTRGDASATAVQAGCPPAATANGPITLMLQPPPTKCVGFICTGQDPYESACSTGASVVGSGPITEGASPIGTLNLYFSPACGTSWGQAVFDDGNPPSTPPVDVSVVGTDPSASTPYDTHPVEFVTTGSGSPVWGNMVPSSSCSYAIVKRGHASGVAVQSGCPTPGHGSNSPGAGVLTASGENIQVIGGVGVPGRMARFTDSDTTVRASYFTVTINWGDGSGESTGHVVGLNGQFTVGGTHRYPDPTQPGVATAQGWNVTVTIVAADGTTTTAYSSVEVVGRDTPVTMPSDNSPPAMSSGDKPVNIGLGILGTIGASIGCGAGIFGEVPSLGTDSPFTTAACVIGVPTGLAATGVGIHDPPDRRFRRVFRARVPRLPAAPERCGHIPHSVCVSVHTALVRYLHAYLRAETLLEDVGVTADRFGGAAAARDRKGERLQRNAEHRYFSSWVAAVHARQAGGRRLGVLLQLHGLDRRITAAQVTAGRQRMLQAEVSPTELATLRRLGIATSAAQVIEEAKQQLSWAPAASDTTLSAVLGH